MKTEQRSEPRETIALPVHLAGGKSGVTRDISASGVYFEIDCTRPLGSEIELAVELSLDGRAMRLACRGQVVRMEDLGGRYGLAVQITESRLVDCSM